MITLKSRLWIASGVVAVAAMLAIAPGALSALSGSGNVEDIVQLDTTTDLIAALSSTASGGSASGSPVTSGLSAFTMTNSGSNVDTFLRYGWGTTPYYGGLPSQTAITLRTSSIYVISDLLWFQQQTLTAAGTPTTSEYFSPLLVQDAATVATSTFTSLGDACSSTTWSGTAGTDFSAAAAGTITFQYYPASSQTNDAPLTSDTIHYCLDTTHQEIYLGEYANFDNATRVHSYATASVSGVLKTYQYQPLAGAQVRGNHYCLVDITGSSTAATPVLAQCQKLAYEVDGSATAKLFVLHDPPAYFPSVNQNGAITYGVSGTQWNPYTAATTGTA